MSNTTLKTGMKFIYKNTGKEFTLTNVTEKRVSWAVENNYKGGNGINTLSKAWTSLKNFSGCIANGVYIPVN